MNVVHEFVPHAHRREDKTAAILDAAMRLMAAEGLEALTLQRLSREFGLVTTAMYRYFPSKDALWAALQRRAVSTIHAHFTEVRVASQRAFAGRSPKVAALGPLLAVSRAYVALPVTHPEAFRLVAVLLGDPRRLIGDEEALRTAVLVDAFLREVDELFVHAARAEALEASDDPRSRTLILWSALHGLTQLDKLRRVAPGTPSAESLASDAACALLRGLGADRALLTRALRALSS